MKQISLVFLMLLGLCMQPAGAESTDAGDSGKSSTPPENSTESGPGSSAKKAKGGKEEEEPDCE